MAKISDSEWRARAEAASSTWVILPKSSSHKGFIKCNVCLNYRWVLGSAVARGRGCPDCRKTTPEEWDTKASLVGAMWIVRPKGSGHKGLMKCNTCAREWNILGSNVHNGQGCLACSGKLQIDEGEWARRAREVLAEWVEVPRKNSEKCKARCLTCNMEWLTTGRDVYSGYGCPNCAKYGYSPGKPGWFYLFTILSERSGDAFTGFGITNKLGDRHAKHVRNLSERGYKIVRSDAWMWNDGTVARDLEASIKKWDTPLSLDVPGFKTESLYGDRWEEVLDAVRAAE